MEGLFPIRRALLAISITLFAFAGLLYELLDLQRQLKLIHRSHFPLIELNAQAFRTNLLLKQQIEIAALSGESQPLDSFWALSDSNRNNLTEFKQLAHDIRLASVTELVDRQELDRWQRKAAKYIQAGRNLDALQILRSPTYAAHQAGFTRNLQQIADELSARRRTMLSEMGDRFRFYLIILFLNLGVAAASWGFVLKRYQFNVQKRTEMKKRLDAQKLHSLHTAKLAALGDMASGMAHEINNPLAIINGYTQRILREAKKDKPDHANIETQVSNIQRIQKRISQIIEGVRDFARDASSDPFEPTALKRIFQDTLALKKERLKTQKIDLRVPVVSSNITLECQGHEISHVLLNLISNSEDAVRDLDQKWIQIDIQENDPHVLISVSDSGRGVPEDIRDKIMLPFFTSKEVGQGTGLGLSAAKGIVERHGGTLYLDTECPYTRFVILLPKEQNQAHKIAA